MSFTLRRAAADTGLRRDLFSKRIACDRGERSRDHLHLLNWVTLVSRSLGSRASPKIVRVGIIGGGGARDEWLKVGWMMGGRRTCGMARLVKRHTTGQNSFNTPGFFSHLAELKQKNLAHTIYYYFPPT